MALFIDGADFDEVQGALGVRIDYRKLRYAFEARGRLLRAYYYAPADGEALIAMRPLLGWLAYNGYEVREKGAPENTDRKRRGSVSSMGIDLTVDVMELAPHLQTVILLGGDDNYKPLVKSVQAQGVRVVVVSTLKVKSVMVGSSLRRQADEFIDIADMLPAITLRRPEQTEPADNL